MYTDTQTNKHTHKCVSDCTDTHSHAYLIRSDLHIRTHTNMYTHTQTNTHTHKCVSDCTDTHTHTSRSNLHIHTNTQTCTQTHKQTNTHTSVSVTALTHTHTRTSYAVICTAISGAEPIKTGNNPPACRESAKKKKSHDRYKRKWYISSRNTNGQIKNDEKLKRNNRSTQHKTCELILRRICVWVCARAHTHSICVWVYARAHTHSHMYPYIHTHVHVHTKLWHPFASNVCVYVCMYVCTGACACAHIYTH